MRKYFIGFILFIFVISAGAVSAEMLDTQYIASIGYSTVNQGANGWFYQVKKDGKYYDMEYDSSSDMLKWRKEDIVSGNYINAKMMHPGSGYVSTARVFEAPYSGTVYLEPNGNVCKSGIGGDGITLRIFKNAELLWEQFLEGTDNIGYAYSLKIQVVCGDRLYFEIDGGALDHYGATIWDPKVTYTQAVAFSVGGVNITSTADIKKGNRLECAFYDGENSVKGNAYMYAAIYDNLGRLRKLTPPQNVSPDENPQRCVSTYVTMDLPGTYEDYKVSVSVLTGENGRYYQPVLSDSLYIK